MTTREPRSIEQCASCATDVPVYSSRQLVDGEALCPSCRRVYNREKKKERHERASKAATGLESREPESERMRRLGLCYDDRPHDPGHSPNGTYFCKRCLNTLEENPAHEMDLYHGSEERLHELDANDPGYTGSLGYGLYLTTLPAFAETFGRHIHRVHSPVPDDLVANIDPIVYDCGNDLTFYTPGSAPFSFDIEPAAGGDPVRYSVLGDCEEQVKAGLVTGVWENTEPSQEAMRDAKKSLSRPQQQIFSAAYKVARSSPLDPHFDRMAERAIDEVVSDTCDWDDRDAALDALIEILEDVEEQATKKVNENLGLELDLSDLSAEMMHLGYSAFWIDGYAPGDEYVIFDEKFLPVPVIDVDAD